MSVSARLDDSILNKLNLISQIEGLSKSKIIAKSISEYFKRHIPDNTPYKIGELLFGKYQSGKSDLSSNRKKYLKEKLNEKYRNY
ncbi:MAG: transcriptional regulator [Candidatus Hydrogenedentota bacterium]